MVIKKNRGADISDRDRDSNNFLLLYFRFVREGFMFTTLMHTLTFYATDLRLRSLVDLSFVGFW